MVMGERAKFFVDAKIAELRTQGTGVNKPASNEDTSSGVARQKKSLGIGLFRRTGRDRMSPTSVVNVGQAETTGQGSVDPSSASEKYPEYGTGPVEVIYKAS